jgi:hypothetical protein
MLIADGTAAKMEVGEHQTFLVTNEIHNIDPFWKSGLLVMIICGFFAFSHSYLKRVSHEAKKYEKFQALLKAGGKFLSIFDDLVFLAITMHKDKKIL